MNIDEQMLEAWKDAVAPPLDQITSHECDECAEVTAFFGGRPWTDLVDSEALRYHESALALFTPCAFLYYLPAFIRAAIADPVRGDVIPDSIRSSVRLEFGIAERGKLGLFTSAQRAVLGRFLREMAARDVFDGGDVEEVVALAELLEEA